MSNLPGLGFEFQVSSGKAWFISFPRGTPVGIGTLANTRNPENKTFAGESHLVRFQDFPPQVYDTLRLEPFLGGKD